MALMKKLAAMAGLAVVSILAWVPPAFAEAAAQDTQHTVNKYIALAAGFGISLAAIGGAIAQGWAVSTTLDGIARNPNAVGKMFVPMILGLALIESLVIYALVISFTLIGKIA